MKDFRRRFHLPLTSTQKDNGKLYSHPNECHYYLKFYLTHSSRTLDSDMNDTFIPHCQMESLLNPVNTKSETLILFVELILNQRTLHILPSSTIY